MRITTLLETEADSRTGLNAKDEVLNSSNELSLF